MSEKRHYDRFATRPARESMYAFLVTGFAISDAEPSVPPWFGPVEITPDMAPRVQAYLKRQNYWLSIIENVFRISAIERLRRAGFPELSLAAPLSPEVESLVMALMKGDRLAHLCEQVKSADPPRKSRLWDGQNADRELCARVIGIACLERSGGYEATAKYLNQGLLSSAQGLSRHHVRRALKTLRESWRGSSRKDALARYMVDCDLLAALDIVYAQARTHPVFRKYRGEALAKAIHEDRDLNEPVHRALKQVQARRSAIV